MATFTESAIDVTLELRRASGEDRVFVSAQSRTATGESIRSVVEFDVTGIVPAGLTPFVTDLLNAAESYLKASWNIP